MRGQNPQIIETQVLRVYQTATRKANQLATEVLITDESDVKSLKQLNSIYFLALQKAVVPVLTQGKLNIDKKVSAMKQQIVASVKPNETLDKG